MQTDIRTDYERIRRVGSLPDWDSTKKEFFDIAITIATGKGQQAEAITMQEYSEALAGLNYFNRIWEQFMRLTDENSHIRTEYEILQAKYSAMEIELHKCKESIT